MDHEMMPSRPLTVNPSASVETEMLVRQRTTLSQELRTGMQAAVGAAYMMGLTAMVVIWIQNWSPWALFNNVAGALMPSLAAAGSTFSFPAIMLGTLIHFSVSVVLGLLFALLYGRVIQPHFNDGVPVLAGLIFGILTWLAAHFTVVPFLGSEIYGTLPFLLVHLVFGATLGLLYPIMPGLKSKV